MELTDLTDFQQKVLGRFARIYQDGFAQTPLEFAGNAKISVTRAAERMATKGVLLKTGRGYYLSMELGIPLALKWRDANPDKLPKRKS